jgi:hypothetical protein
MRVFASAVQKRCCGVARQGAGKNKNGTKNDEKRRKKRTAEKRPNKK